VFGVVVRIAAVGIAKVAVDQIGFGVFAIALARRKPVSGREFAGAEDRGIVRRPRAIGALVKVLPFGRKYLRVSSGGI
jgi:hypothetical protein